MLLSCTLIKPTPFALLRLALFWSSRSHQKGLTRALLVLLWVYRAIFPQTAGLGPIGHSLIYEKTIQQRQVAMYLVVMPSFTPRLPPLARLTTRHLLIKLPLQGRAPSPPCIPRKILLVVAAAMYSKSNCPNGSTPARPTCLISSEIAAVGSGIFALDNT
ncbi:hypothetical protein CI102_12186 [Trichoderma harzianum]|nr:hypothetical protein CI102_12186 [Trichoderma harzianum]